MILVRTDHPCLRMRRHIVIYAPYIQRIINFNTEMKFGYELNARATPASGHAPSDAPESSRAATHRGMKQNILGKGLKTLISMCRSNDALIRESHQQISQRLSHLEERQREMCTTMGLETPKPTIYAPLPPPAVEGPWAWYRNADDDGEVNDEADEEIQEESE
jgi:hypothetical protein